MQYNKVNIGKYDVHVIKTDKFKTISVRINFKNKLTKEDLMEKFFLADLLPFVSSKYKTERELEIQSEELYDTNINIRTSKSGYYRVFSIRQTFLNEKYTEEGMNQKNIEFLKEIIFNPNIENQQFDEKTFNRIKRVMFENLRSTQDNPRAYSLIKMREAMDKNNFYAIDPFLEMDMLDKITSQNLYLSYINMLKNDKVDIFVIGDIEIDNIKNLFNSLIIENNNNDKHEHKVENKKFRKKEQIIIESFNSNQSKLAIAFKLKKLTDFERRYVLNIYSHILGGSGDSKLFKNLRENNSLCYNVNSHYNNIYNILEIEAGINSKNFDLSLKLIKEEMKNMENGAISDDEINKAVNTYISACKNLYDKQNSIIDDYLAHEYFKNDLIEDKIINIKKVTKQDLINLSKKICIDTIYLLKGESENEQN
ncbi:MAG: insulinase family protein [Bacilli bacterium]|nr:insulinase family protein [Bacilli bacterium]